MHTPEEACDALTHAVDELGFRAVLLAGYVQRPAAAIAETNPDAAPWALWLDMPSSYLIDASGKIVAVESGFRDEQKVELEARIRTLVPSH